MKKQYLEVPFEVKEIREDENFFYYEGYASTFGNIDYGMDKCIKGCFSDTIKSLKPVTIKGSEEKSLLPALWQHDMTQPIGSYSALKEDEKGLFVRGILPKKDSLVSGRVIPQMEVGSIKNMSIGYIAVKVKNTANGVRELIKVILKEISLVTFPMNDQAEITGIKGATRYNDLMLAPRSYEWDSSAAIRRLREFLDSEEDPGPSYKRGFLWYDEANKENFGAYKLPFCDIVYGELRAVPRAIFAAAAALRGARGGVDIPEQDKVGVISHINQYYRKMDLESPIQESMSFRIDDIESMDEKSLEKVLRGGVYMNQRLAKKFVSHLKPLLNADVKNDSDRDEQKKGDWSEVLNKINNIKEKIGD